MTQFLSEKIKYACVHVWEVSCEVFKTKKAFNTPRCDSRILLAATCYREKIHIFVELFLAGFIALQKSCWKLYKLIQKANGLADLQD
jgi:hypothetical protein